MEEFSNNTEVACAGRMRALRNFLHRWKGLLIVCVLLYGFVAFAPFANNNYFADSERPLHEIVRDYQKAERAHFLKINKNGENNGAAASVAVAKKDNNLVEMTDEEKKEAERREEEKRAEEEEIRDNQRKIQERMEKEGIKPEEQQQNEVIQDNQPENLNQAPEDQQNSVIDEKQGADAVIMENKSENKDSEIHKDVAEVKENKQAPEAKPDEPSGTFEFSMQAANGEKFTIVDVMTDPNIKTSLRERMTFKGDAKAPPKLIIAKGTGLSQANMGGCPEWNCEVSRDYNKKSDADAIIFASHGDGSVTSRDPKQYYIYFSQESPVNSGFGVPYSNFFNMSFGFRHDTAAASPYGYTVKLAESSKLQPPFINETLVKGKTKAAAWYVSHCYTNSRREDLVKEMQKTINVDIYGGCGTLKCGRGADCENALDTEYHFYIAFENSICKDYITEKVWNQGYKREIIPVVLKRSLAEPFLPPNSFIAADDYKTVNELTKHMQYLMNNKTAYMEYFNWRRDYRVVFLNGREHDALERPWGMCQICRILWEEPRPHQSIEAWEKWWGGSCEKDGALVQGILGNPIESNIKNDVNKLRGERVNRP